MITETIFEAVLDTLKLLPFLYLTYLAMEYLEERAEEKMIRTLWKYEKAGPAIGAALGIVPQCGFSASAVPSSSVFSDVSAGRTSIRRSTSSALACDRSSEVMEADIFCSPIEKLRS